MNKKIVFLLFFLLITLIIPCVFAQKNTIKLLAINEATKEGTIVNLDLTIVEGSGKVFIETYPLSQIDMQISLRIAKMIACKTSGIYCLDKDFMYSIKADAPIIAGPSAGAAMTLLTMASLENKKINSEIIITGTISSGGVIGSVGGLKEKISAAANKSLKKVLIPKGELNATKISEYRSEYNIDIVEMSNIEEAYKSLTDEDRNEKELSIDDEYLRIMKKLNEDICERTETMKKEIEKYNLSGEKIGFAMNLSKESFELNEKGYYYSSASRCFGANVYFRELLLNAENINISKAEIEKKIEDVKKELYNLEIFLNNTEINNLGDLEAVMIIRERIYDAKKNIENSTEISDLSYAIERVHSSNSWKKFLGFKGKQIDETKLKESCALKISEVNELYNYVAIYFPSLMIETKKELDSTKEYYDSGDYILCLFKSSKSEAEINAALSMVYIEDSHFKQLLQNKIIAAKKIIINQIQKGNFPILGYSYYEYATALNDTGNYNSLLYAEYGIELSNLDIYFPLQKPFPVRINEKALTTLILGFLIGFTLFMIRKQYRRKRIVLRR